MVRLLELTNPLFDSMASVLVPVLFVQPHQSLPIIHSKESLEGYDITILVRRHMLRTPEDIVHQHIGRPFVTGVRS
jgi:hypothetical protein